MPRINAPELEDAEWYPPILRDALTGYLLVSHEVLGRAIYASTAPVIHEAMASIGTRRIVDLCSGSGGPVLLALEQLRKGPAPDATAVLTDKFPNLAAFERARAQHGEAVSFRSDSIDATAPPAELDGVRTLFNALHHLPPDAARAMFADAADKMQPILSFEVVERSWQGALLALTAVPNTLAFMPFVQPRRLANFALTYLLPVLPMTITWDTFASCLRSYSLDELRAMTEPLNRADYSFRVERHRPPGAPTFVTSVIGMPTRKR